MKLPLEKDAKRPDVSEVSLFVRAKISGSPEHAEEITKALREFAENASPVGRTEIDVESETAISVARPERYRLELIKAIADDANNVRAELGNSCALSIEGLSSRIEWERISVSELMLYIPYTMKIEGCASGAAR